MQLSHIPRQLIRECASVLSQTPAWRRRPCGSLKSLIYGLNTISASYPFLNYGHGMPRPSEVRRELERLEESVRKADSSGKIERVVRRLDALARKGADSHSLLVFAAASALRPDRPEAVVQCPSTMEYLVELARRDPIAFADLIAKAKERLIPFVLNGRGGNRHQGALVTRDITLELGILIQNIVGRRPGVTYNAEEGTYSGRFVSFARLVFKHIGLDIKERQLNRHLKVLDLPEWRRRYSGSNPTAQ